MIVLAATWTIYDETDICYISSRSTEVHRLVAIAAVSLLGFTLMTTTVTLNLQASPRLDRVRSSQNYMEMWDIFFKTMRTLRLLTIISVLCLMYYRPTSPYKWLETPLFPLMGLAVLRMTRILWILQRVVRIIAKPSGANVKGL